MDHEPQDLDVAEYGWPPDKDGRLVIPEGVVLIRDSAFAKCAGIKSVIFPKSLVTIGYRAFNLCAGLISLMLPSSVTSIERSAFYGCTSLTSLIIPESVVSIGINAFRECSGLTTVTIPDSVTTIGYEAFKACTGLVAVSLPNSVGVLDGTFSGCSALVSVKIPGSVTSIKTLTFAGCSNLTSVTFMAESVTNIGPFAFSSCTALVSAPVPKSVTIIGANAFDGCISLTSLVIPNTVSSVGNGAFKACNGLQSVWISDSPLVPFDIGLVFDSCSKHVLALATDAKDRAEISAASKLRMSQFSIAKNLQSTVAFNATKARHELKTLLSVANRRQIGEPQQFFTPVDGSLAETTEQRFRQMIRAQPTLLQPDTAPLSERLISVSEVLNICLQYELLIPPPAIHRTVDFKQHMEVHVNPAIRIITQELGVMKDQVGADPEKYRQLLVDLSTADHVIYDSSFQKTINPYLGGDKNAYKIMIQKCVEVQKCKLSDVQAQPTGEMIPLVLMVRENIPFYKEAVEAIVADANVTVAVAPTIIYRPNDETKSPYRILEKALTKGPNRTYPDCSKVMDIFGCIIKCADFVSMAAVIDMFTYKHNRGEVVLSRIKERWSNWTTGGWRDLMLNLVINGVVFEVQIVHSTMLGARAAMEAHKAYNQFRSFTETFELLGLDPLHVEEQPQKRRRTSSVLAEDALEVALVAEREARIAGEAREKSLVAEVARLQELLKGKRRD